MDKEELSIETLLKINNSSLLVISELLLSVEMLLADVYNGKAMRYSNGMLDQDGDMVDKLREIHNVINKGGVDNQK